MFPIFHYINNISSSRNIVIFKNSFFQVHDPLLITLHLITQRSFFWWKLWHDKLLRTHFLFTLVTNLKKNLQLGFFMFGNLHICMWSFSFNLYVFTPNSCIMEIKGAKIPYIHNKSRKCEIMCQNISRMLEWSLTSKRNKFTICKVGVFIHTTLVGWTLPKAYIHWCPHAWWWLQIWKTKLPCFIGMALHYPSC